MTFHGPGQLVCYPILDLRNYKMDLRWYIRALQTSLIDFLKKSCHLETNCTSDVGVWVQHQRKIAAIGKFFWHDSLYIFQAFLFLVFCCRILCDTLDHESWLCPQC